jgi:hypothetical protein
MLTYRICIEVLEKRVQRSTFGLKREEVTRVWRKLHYEEFHDLYSLPDVN